MQQIAQTSTTRTAIKALPPPLISVTHQLKPITHFPNPAISAKWGRRRSGSPRSRKLILNSIAFVASNLKILPEPWGSMARELWVASAASSGGGGGGNGGKFWLGGGGEGRNRRRESLGFWVPLMVSSALALWVVLERERGGRESELWFWVLLLVVSAFGVYCLVRGWRREIRDWMLGFSCGAAFMGLGLRNNENLVKLVDQCRAKTLNCMPIGKKRRRARRWI